MGNEKMPETRGRSGVCSVTISKALGALEADQ